jgi:hypothetical protein
MLQSNIGLKNDIMGKSFRQRDEIARKAVMAAMHLLAL